MASIKVRTLNKAEQIAALKKLDARFEGWLYLGIREQNRYRATGSKSADECVQRDITRLETLAEVYEMLGVMDHERRTDLEISFEVLRNPEEF